jgi:hypothetical protein
MSEGRNTNPILVTGSHRAGTTWVGKMLALSVRTCYLGEILRPGNRLLDGERVPHWFLYVTAETGGALFGPLHRILSFDFTWPKRRGLRRLVPSRLALFRRTRRWFGLPRPIMKDPIAAMSAEWLAGAFQMDVLCLVRHPAAFVASLKRVNWRFDFTHFLHQPRLMEDWLHPFAGLLSQPPDDIVEEGALLWLCIYHVLSGYLQRHPEWACWRLEDLSADPLAAFARIYAQLGLPYTARIRRRVAGYSAATNPAEAPIADPHYIRRDSRAAQSQWHDLLAPQEVLRVRRVVEPLASRFYSEADWSTRGSR